MIRTVSNLLIVDSDPNLCADVGNFFHSIGDSVHQASDYAGALLQLEKHEFDVAIIQVNIPGGNVHELLQRIKKKNPSTAVIVDAELESIQEGVQAIQEGAFSILQKPFSIPELNFQIKRALDQQAPRSEPGTLADRYRNIYQPYNFIGESEEIKKIFRIVNRVAATDSSVIILGETGTGKELVAGAIHYNSPRSDGPFVRVNCAALPEQLLESELFGHERGAFTGADRQRIGRFEHADGGTIFLDEIADMSQYTQAKVLRVIQEKEFERLGSNETVKTNVRIISATNRDLMQRMQQGLFREDLYYRLNVVPIRVPPLREREGDVELLANHFVEVLSAENGRPVKRLTKTAMALLESYRWPGNVRELRNFMERVVIMTDKEELNEGDLLTLEPALGAGARRDDGAKGVLKSRLEDEEERSVRETLRAAGWNVSEAARRLGIDRASLHRKMRRYGITRKKE